MFSLVMLSLLLCKTFNNGSLFNDQSRKCTTSRCFMRSQAPLNSDDSLARKISHLKAGGWASPTAYRG